MQFAGRVIGQNSFADMQEDTFRLLRQHVLGLFAPQLVQGQVEVCKVLICVSVAGRQVLPIMLSCQMQCAGLTKTHHLGSVRFRYYYNPQ